MSAVQSYFLPELLNRMDDVLIFNQLTRENMGGVLTLQLKDVTKR